jgi:hypothetical protein
MKFLKWLAIILLFLVLLPAFFYISSYKGNNSQIIINIIILVSILLVIFLIVEHYITRSKLPGGLKGARLQGIWVLEKHFRFDPVLKKYEALPVVEKKNYFEFKDSNFCSGDFDEKLEQLPAEYSPFSVDGDKLVLGSEFLKKANWKWIYKNARLELTGEMESSSKSTPNNKNLFIFYKKYW